MAISSPNIPGSCLDRLAPRDFSFLVQTVFDLRDDGSLASLLSERETLLSVLEHERVFRKIVEIPFPLSISPELYFFVLVRRSLKDAGIEDVRIADYVAATLASHAGGWGEGPERPSLDFTYQVDFLESIAGVGAYERFFLQVACGNRFLVLTGLFPNFLESRSSRRGAPGLGYYEEVARSAFIDAGSHPLAEEFDLRSVYAPLASALVETRRALNRMAEEYLFLGR